MTLQEYKDNPSVFIQKRFRIQPNEENEVNEKVEEEKVSQNEENEEE